MNLIQFSLIFVYLFIVQSNFQTYAIDNTLISSNKLYPLRKRYPPFPSGYPIKDPIPLPYGPIYGCRGLAMKLRDRQFDPYSTFEEESFNCPYPIYSNSELEKYMDKRQEQREKIQQLPPSSISIKLHPPRLEISKIKNNPDNSELERIMFNRYLQYHGIDPTWYRNNIKPKTVDKISDADGNPYYDKYGFYHSKTYVHDKPLTKSDIEFMRLMWPYRVPWLKYPDDKKPSNDNNDDNKSESDRKIYNSFDPYRLVRLANNGRATLPGQVEVHQKIGFKVPVGGEKIKESFRITSDS